MSVKIGDVCRVIKQPDNQFVRLLGKIGFIQEMNERFASFESLKLDGSIDGAGCVPIDCLAEETSSDWIRAKQLYDERSDKHLQEGLERGRRWSAKLTELGNKYSLTTEQVQQIYSELVNFSEYM